MPEEKTTTISVIKADVGSLPGHVIVPDCMLEILEEHLRKEMKESKLLNDYYVFNCGDDIELVLSHNRGEDDEKIHELAWNGFMDAAEHARKNKFYGAGQDLLADSFSGNVKGQGPGVAEMEFVERKSDPLLVFACDKTDPAAFNLPLFKAFADPFNTAGLVIDPSTTAGFEFEIVDVYDSKKVRMSCPEEMYSMLALLGTTSRYAVKRIWKKGEESEKERVACSVCTEKLNVSAGKYVGKDDPVAICRAQSGMPAVGEILEGFTTAHLVSGWMRGSHKGPLMPVARADASPTRFDGPPRVVGKGFQVSHGKLHGPRDLFADVSFDHTRKQCMEIAHYMRQHGPFEPHRVSEKELEYTTMPQVMDALKERFEDI